MIKYRKGYKYQLADDYVVETGLQPGTNIETHFIDLNVFGELTIRKGYAWDGPSGPTFDTKNFMRGSLVHDALYQLMRQGRLPQSFRDPSDRLLQAICREDGMSAARAWWVYTGLKYGGAAAAKVENQKEVFEAP